MKESGYYWCLIKDKHREEWDILWWNNINKNWVLDGEKFNESENRKIIEIDEKQIKRNE